MRKCRNLEQADQEKTIRVCEKEPANQRDEDWQAVPLAS